MRSIINRIIGLTLIAIVLIFANSCSKDDGSGSDDVVVVKTPIINVNKTSIQFDDTMITKSSNSSTFSGSSQKPDS